MWYFKSINAIGLSIDMCKFPWYVSIFYYLLPIEPELAPPWIISLLELGTLNILNFSRPLTDRRFTDIRDFDITDQ